MNLIKTFGLVVKPKITKGKKMMNPLNHQILDGYIYCLRDKDVNCFLIRNGKSFIAIDSGYMNSENIRTGLSKFNIQASSVTDCFLTHLDIDHAGGVSDNTDKIFPNAKIHLSFEESKYLNDKYIRKTILGHKCKLPIQLSNYECFSDNEEFKFENIRIKTVLIPGHTLGHSGFILNDGYLFCGDCIIANEDGGYLFFDFWNQDIQMNKTSVHKLKRYVLDNSIDSIITSHSGVLNRDIAFSHIDTSPDWRKKGFGFCKNADFDPYAQ
ncbi:MAG: MBL fold metallo-hydrolase [Spirochaetaceae bacterium]|nr:MBL fold metallo-hydrolase [Spirochaetaceae bacterium]